MTKTPGKVNRKVIGTKLEPHPDTDALVVKVEISEYSIAGSTADMRATMAAAAKAHNEGLERKRIVRQQTADLALQRLRANKKQADRARLGGKLSKAQRARMKQQYDLRVRNGQKYGAMKALGVMFDVDPRTVRSVVAPKKSRK